MNIKIVIVVVSLCITGCADEPTGIEICFKNIQKRIASDSVLERIKVSSLESYGEHASIINNAMKEESKASSICSNAIADFLEKNDDNSATVNNLILFQQFQAYLNHEKFDKTKAKELALSYEKKWK